jgi:hypothetical protein
MTLGIDVSKVFSEMVMVRRQTICQLQSDRVLTETFRCLPCRRPARRTWCKRRWCIIIWLPTRIRRRTWRCSRSTRCRRTVRTRTRWFAVSRCGRSHRSGVLSSVDGFICAQARAALLRRLPGIVEYAMLPMRKALNDPSPYVRKTAVTSIAKMWRLFPSQIKGAACWSCLRSAQQLACFNGAQTRIWSTFCTT